MKISHVTVGEHYWIHANGPWVKNLTRRLNPLEPISVYALVVYNTFLTHKRITF